MDNLQGIEDFMALNREFMKRARVRTSFNLKSQDIGSLEYKEEIRTLFNEDMFTKLLNPEKYYISSREFKQADGSKQRKNVVQKAIEKLRAKTQNSFKYLYNYNIKGVGPGEVMFYYLTDDLFCGGGSSDVDLNFQGGKANSYELKSSLIRKSDGTIAGFFTGGRVVVDQLVTEIKKLAAEGNINTGSEANGVSSSGIVELRKNEVTAGRMKIIEDKYRDIVHKNYFAQHKFIFTSNETAGGYLVGDIMYMGNVPKKNIYIDSITQGKFKPRLWGLTNNTHLTPYK